jgi:Cof subfamily protein (haloacid dehalogenase superfamily)
VVLIVFDLYGTLLDRSSAISGYTRDTLRRLSERGIAYTVATGRTLHGSRSILDGHGFRLPQVYKNGVMIWDPRSDGFSHRQVMQPAEIENVVAELQRHGVAPFIFTAEAHGRHAVYHPPSRSRAEAELAEQFAAEGAVELVHTARLPAASAVTHVSAIGPGDAIRPVEEAVAAAPALVAYAGNALEGMGLRWIDVHHCDASKGSAVDMLRAQLGASRVLCFGDGKNDLSMFAHADESYAPENADPEVKAAATAVIGHNDQDGIARFLRKLFDLSGG